MPNIPHPRDIPMTLQDMRSEFDRLLDRVWHGGLATAPLDGQDWAPCMEVIEEEDRYRVRAEIPGLTGDDVSVTILGDTLTVKGTKPAPESTDEHSRNLRTECRYGSFCRKYAFPTPIQEEGVTAACKNGVLEITVQKAVEVKGRTVRIEPNE